MMFTRLTLWVCGFYLALTIALDMVLLLLARLRGIAGIHATRNGWWVIFGAMWAISFALASQFSSFFKR